MSDIRTMLVEAITLDCLMLWMKETGKQAEEALKDIYTSKTMEKLSDEETGLYSQSSAYVYEFFKEEQESGSFVQREI